MDWLELKPILSNLLIAASTVAITALLPFLWRLPRMIEKLDSFDTHLEEDKTVHLEFKDRFEVQDRLISQSIDTDIDSEKIRLGLQPYPNRK